MKSKEDSKETGALWGEALRDKISDMRFELLVSLDEEARNPRSLIIAKEIGDILGALFSYVGDQAQDNLRQLDLLQQRPYGAESLDAPL